MRIGSRRVECIVIFGFGWGRDWYRRIKGFGGDSIRVWNGFEITGRDVV